MNTLLPGERALLRELREGDILIPDPLRQENGTCLNPGELAAAHALHTRGLAYLSGTGWDGNMVLTLAFNGDKMLARE